LKGSRSKPIRAVVLAALAALAWPAVAQAHSSSIVVAIDYRVHIDRVPAGIEARVIDGDRKLRLRVDPRATVLVLGYARDPFLRFSPKGVEVNDFAPTAWSDRLARGSGPKFGGARLWRLASSGHAFTWHEHRLAPPAPQGRTIAWTVPLVVDGRPAAVTGTYRKVARPALWPWLVIGAVFLAASAVLLRRPRPGPARIAALAFACLSGAAALAALVAVTLAGAVGHGKGIELGAAGALAAAAVGLLLLWPRGRAVTVGGIASLGLIEGLGLLGVFVHGVVIADLPATATRVAAALAVFGGGSALLLVLLDGLVWDERSPQRA
jgi:hypothetical protein